MKPAIEVRGISKRYTINHKNKASYRTLKDDLANIFRRPLGLADRSVNKEEEFWALRDISFDVQQGEIFGIIGRNGSGKSTLLKIMSRIVEPTTGTIHLRGTTASLLEVGTGFHPELTGRENIYFNGSMIGMSRQEITRKFNEIVDFSEIEKFLDTPVKFYSSGMYVRLAFSVAAHLEPDILILDEVLAVGDARFQKKCLSKILSIAQGGRTVLFVSHSMAAVEELCSKAILLDNGRIKLMGDTDVVAGAYMEDNSSANKVSGNRVDESYGQDITIKDIKCAQDTSTFLYNDKLSFAASIESNLKIKEPLTLGIGVNNPLGVRIFTYETEKYIILNKKLIKVNFDVLSPQLRPGHYSLSLGISVNGHTLDFVPEALPFRISRRDKNGNSHQFLHDPSIDGYVAPKVNVELLK